MKITSINDLLVLELQDLYSCEEQILDAAPKMMKASTNPKLKKAFKDHIKETEVQAKRLEKIAKKIDFNPQGKLCEGMKGIIKEGDEIVKQDIPSLIKDIAITSAGQKVEHYEMVGYKSAMNMSKKLQLKEVSELLKETFDEEEKSDKLLLEIGKSELLSEVYSK